MGTTVKCFPFVFISLVFPCSFVIPSTLFIPCTVKPPTMNFVEKFPRVSMALGCIISICSIK